jgi:hypothetical protein
MSIMPKANPERRREDEPLTRVFEYCPDCKHYLPPGFRTDMCVFCHADFSETPEYKAAVSRDMKLRAYMKWHYCDKNELPL